jgi:hypothetical protein
MPRCGTFIALTKSFHTLFAVIDVEFAFQNVGDQRYRVAMKSSGGNGGNRPYAPQSFS